MAVVIDPYQSRKMTVLSFFCAALVILLHSYNWYYLEGGDGTAAYVVTTFFSQAVCCVAVPFFFVQSGYLFFHDVSRLAETRWQDWYSRKLKKRFFSIVLPYFYWALIGFVLVMSYEGLLSLLHGKNLFYFAKEGFSPWYFFRDFLWDDGKHTHMIHLWYLRRLMCFFLISPLIYGIFRLHRSLLPFVGIGIVCFAHYVKFPLSNFLDASLLCFLIGSWLSLAGIPVQSKYLKYSALPLLFLWCGWCLLPIIPGFSPYFPLTWPLRDLRNLLGVCALWCGYDFFHSFCSRYFAGREKALEICGMSFFIYISHVPLLGQLGHVLQVKISCEFIRYAGTFGGTLLICILSGLLLKRYCPRIYRALSGARS